MLTVFKIKDSCAVFVSHGLAAFEPRHGDVISGVREAEELQVFADDVFVRVGLDLDRERSCNRKRMLHCLNEHSSILYTYK